MTPAYPPQAAVFVGLHLGSLAVIAGSAWVFGETVLRRARLEEPARERWALAAALGLGLIAQGMLVLGVAGLLSRPVVLALLVLAHAPCRRTWRWLLGRRLLGRLRARHLALAAALAPWTLLALYPPTGVDATVYHLPYVEAFLDAGRLVFVPELRFPVFPQVVEMGFVLAFFLSGEIAAQLTQVLSTGLVAGLAFAWGRHLFSARAGLWAAALWLGTPLVVRIGAMAFVDVGLTLFVTAALYCWDRWRRSRDRRWLALAGLFAGWAAGTKYLGLFFCVALFALTAVHARRTWRPLVTFVLAATVVLAPWYARIVHHTGNPVFPYYSSLFGASEWTTVHDQKVGAEPGEWWKTVTRQVSRIAEGLGFLASTPWNAVFERETFRSQAPLTPFYLLLIPLCAPRVLDREPARRLLLLTAVYGLFWLTTARDLRYLLPVLPALNLVLAGGLDRYARAPRSRLAVAAIAVLLAGPGLFYIGYKIVEQGRPPVTAVQRADYLEAWIPGYGAVRWLNENAEHGYTVYGFSERLRYYAEGRFVGSWLGPASYHRVQAFATSGRRLRRELRRLDACYLLVPRGSPRLPDDARFRKRFRVLWQDSQFVLYGFCGPAGSITLGSR